MATSYEDIYCLNQAIMTDSRINSLPDNLKFFVRSTYLDFAIAEFRKYCYEDLDDRTEFTQEIYEFQTDGVNDTYNLTPSPPSGATYYVTLNSVEQTEGTDYNILTSPDRIQFTTLPATDLDVYVGAYIVGEFTADLNVDEKRILAEGMVAPFQEGNINKTKALDQLLYGSGVKFYSQANHNKTNVDIKDSQYQRLHQMISLYTYTNNPDDNLDGLAGVGQNG